MTKIEQHIESAFSENIRQFIGERKWDVGYCHVKLFGRYTEFINYLIYDNVFDYIIQGDREVSVEQAALDLRKQLYHQTGQRIWALQFCLYPSGEFDIEYSVAPPRGYVDAEDFDFVAEMTIDQIDVSQGVDQLIEKMLPATAHLQQYYRYCRNQLQQKAQSDAHQLWGGVCLQEGIADVNEDLLRLARLKYPMFEINVIGSFDPNSQIWQWGWEHPDIAHDLQEVAYMVLDYAQRHQILQLQQQIVQCSEHDVYNFTALAVDLAAADGAYRIQYNGCWHYVVFLYVSALSDHDIA